MKKMAQKSRKSSSTHYIYGRHACIAALNNPDRTIHQAYITSAAQQEMGALPSGMAKQTMDAKQLAKLLPQDAIHQGIALEVSPLATQEPEAYLTGKPVLILDHLTDPHNVGAILRSAAAFDVGAVFTHERHGARESGTVARSASGALDIVPYVPVPNIANLIDLMKEHHYWVIGLDGNTDTSWEESDWPKQSAIVLGAEGKGLRALTAKKCDALARLSMHSQMESLNVSNATAIALHSLYCQPLR